MTTLSSRFRLADTVAERLLRLTAAERHKVGFPGWSAAFPPPLVPFLSHELNNYGDPGSDPVFPWHTKDLERELVDDLAGLFGACPARPWGHVTNGGSEGVLYGLWLARTKHPRAKVYHSRTAHPCVARNAGMLRMENVAVAADVRGEMSYTDLMRRLLADPNPAAIVVATIGTTLTEAVDDVRSIRAALSAAGKRYHLHADAAMSGIPLALHAEGRPVFGLHAQGADSLSISGHKFLGAPFPCGVVLARTRPARHPGTSDLLCGASDSFASSRNGHAALILWYLLKERGISGLRELAHAGRATAEYAQRRLVSAGWPAWRAHRHARTVVFPAPPRAVLETWALPVVRGVSHIVCTPGVSRSRVDRFVAAVGAAIPEPIKDGQPWTTPSRAV
ncbi:MULTISPECIES: pyridoxal-dependent decarboxylase [unclassified Nonomuraea]|uniref:pyridoxal-dependent decarboxylase n=1 Tax=unclassified Nonomuraea TaxID=2593643 RepID=UPI00137678F5|nr:pyridoxal-dependent decarboxylase [Nonomuraea sp. KC401]NBE96648.1 histidine decarboxylase [Nonomuraea sp. K271]